MVIIQELMDFSMRLEVDSIRKSLSFINEAQLQLKEVIIKKQFVSKNEIQVQILNNLKRSLFNEASIRYPASFFI